MRAAALLSLFLVVAGCRVLGLAGADCAGDDNCPSGEFCGADNVCSPVDDGAEGEGEGEEGEGEGEEGEGEEGEGEEGEGEEGEGEGEEGCVVGGACPAVVVVDDLKEPAHLSLKDNTLFFTSQPLLGGGDFVRAVDKAAVGVVGDSTIIVQRNGGESVTTLVATGADVLYVVEKGVGSADQLVRTPIDGGGSTTVETGVNFADDEGPKIALSLPDVFWLHSGNNSNNLVVNDSATTKATSRSFPSCVAASNDFVYVVDDLGGFQRLGLADLAAGTLQNYASRTADCVDARTSNDGVDVVFALADGGIHLARGGESFLTDIANGGAAVGVAVDDDHVWWVTGGAAGQLHRAAKTAGASPEVVRPAPQATSVVVDDAHVYWTAGGAVGQLSRISKPR